MVTDRLTDRRCSEPILSNSVNLTVTVAGTEAKMIRVNGPLRPGFNQFYELNGKPRNMKSFSF